ncbi:MAG: AGE family epimerase/isomerase [Planctomycetota bacterium]
MVQRGWTARGWAMRHLAAAVGLAMLTATASGQFAPPENPQPEPSVEPASEPVTDPVTDPVTEPVVQPEPEAVVPKPEPEAAVESAPVVRETGARAARSPAELEALLQARTRSAAEPVSQTTVIEPVQPAEALQGAASDVSGLQAASDRRALSGVGLGEPTVVMDDLTAQARSARRALASRVLPFWASMVDRGRGGFAPAWSVGVGRGPVDEVSVLSQAGLTWVFAHTARRGLAPIEIDPWGLAEHGVVFLLGPSRDETHGGFREWVSLNGSPVGDAREVKLTQTQALAIRALVEVHLVTGRSDVLDAAMEAFDRIETHMRDAEHGGWFDEASEGWEMTDAGRVKRAETHLAMLESLTALAKVRPTGRVTDALAHAVEVCRGRFFPLQPGQAVRMVGPDWSALPDRLEHGPVSYGLYASGARAIAAGESALGSQVDIEAMSTRLRVATGPIRGGLVMSGVPLMGYAGRAPMASPRAWWTQAEVATALVEAIVMEPSLEAEFGPLLSGVLAWIDGPQTDADTGALIGAVDEAGTVVWGTIAGPGKFGMLEVRAKSAVAKLDGRPASRSAAVGVRSETGSR